MKHVIALLIVAVIQFTTPAKSGTVELPIVARSTELDGNGHVNNAKFVEYFQWGRDEWMTTAGIGPEQIKNAGLFRVVVNVSVNFRKEVRAGETLKILTWPERCGEKSFTFGQSVVKADGVVAADGTATIVLCDLNTRKAVPLPMALRISVPKSKQSDAAGAPQ